MDNKAVEFRKYIQGKRVAFVAPSRSEIGTGRGMEIDAHDVVIRTNHYHELIANGLYIEDYGKRCDVLYVNVQYARERVLPIGQLKKIGVEWICYKVRVDGMREMSKYFGVRKISDDALAECRGICPSATAGNIILSDIGMIGPDEFNVYGMDFFAGQNRKFDGSFDYYLPGYIPRDIAQQARATIQKGDAVGHDFLNNAELSDYLANKYNIFFTEESSALLDGIMSGRVTRD